MAFKRDYFEALKDIVGPENISEDPVILDSYAAFDAVRPPIFAPRFEAVLLPENVAEVQSIVKFCNRNNIQYKASSTGWGRSSAAVKPGVILLDMVRMNHILEINEKNMYAVVEPHVTASQLQNEVMKVGLNHCVNGSGSQGSALPLTLATGHSTTSLSTSNEERNILGVEWVTPEGEIVRLGSLGSSGKWFSGDGPGPSLRGLLRGSCFTAGGIGVFTAAAKKLYH
jgi:glycolate oxidase